jgi:UDP-N-acetylmuramate--alanine ligase
MPSPEALNDRQNIFFSAIAGSGVSSLALFMAHRGHIVSGSDRQFDSGSGHPLKGRLIEAGIRLVPQDGSGIARELDLMVMSTAVERDRPEVLRAEELGIPIMTRPEFLASLSKDYRTIAIAGTSGKSSASGMLAYALRELGADPNYISGGRVKDFRSTENPGNVLSGGSDLLVMEADESDGTIVNYTPYCSVIANLSLDHNPVEETAGMFRRLISNTSDRTIMNADDRPVMELGYEGALTYSIDSSSDMRAVRISMDGLISRFNLDGQDFEIGQPGRHNIYNSLAAISVLRILGYGLKSIAPAISGFNGIERRFDMHMKNNECMVIDDYAHNPHKLAALMDTIAGLCESACYVFQPHGFGPLRLMLNEYADVFNARLREQDRLFILPVYYSGGTAKRDIGPEDLAGLCRARALENRGLMIQEIEKMRPFGCYAVLGARDESLGDLAEEIADKISARV